MALYKMVNEKCHCEICGVEYNKSYETRHFSSKKHIKMSGGKSEETSNAKGESENDLEENDVNSESAFYQSDDETGSLTDDNDDFLNELNADVFQNPEEVEMKLKEEKKREIELKKMKQADLRDIQFQEKMEKARKKLQKISKEDDGIFTEGDVELMGRERLELIKRITQYKSVFKTELKSIRVPKKNITVEKLNAILDECEALLDLSGVENFVLDGIYQAIKLVEGVSAMTTRFNVSGLSDLLKKDPNFNSLARRLMVRYGSFSQVSPEYQITFIIVVSSYMMMQKNSQKKSFDAFLDQPIPIPPSV